MIVWSVLHVLLFVNISFTQTYMSRTSYDQPQWIPLFQMSCDSPAPDLAESAAATSFLSTHSPIDLLQHFSQSCGSGSSVSYPPQLWVGGCLFSSLKKRYKVLDYWILLHLITWEKKKETSISPAGALQYTRAFDSSTQTGYLRRQKDKLIVCM